MRTCKECGESIEHKDRRVQFCNAKCSNVYKGREVAKANEGSYLRCQRCEKDKPRGMFSYLVKGDVSSGKKSYCKACGAAEKETARRNRGWKDDAARVLFNGSKQRAKRSGMEHTITYDDIHIPDACPVLGIPLHREDRDTWMNAPSLDRIENDKGYIPGNVIVVSRRANLLKKDATVDELIALARFYASIDKEKLNEHFCPT